MYRWIRDDEKHGHYEWFFCYTLSQDEADIFLEDRRKLAHALDGYHQEKKIAEKNRDFETSKFIKKELINPTESMIKAYNIAKFILVDGVGKMPPFPAELLDNVRFLNIKYG